ncbi:MAG: hypothetical protein WB678_14505 [Stellaceae bacterium]
MKLRAWWRKKDAESARVMIDNMMTTHGYGRNLSLREFLTSPYFPMQITKTLELLEGFNPKAQQLILVAVLREVERELPPGEKRLMPA